MWTRAAAAALLLAVAASPTHGEAAGVIEGTVTFAGPVPALPAIPIEAKHREACGAEAPNEALAVDPATRGVKGAVVYLEGVTEGTAPERSTRPAPVALENRRCRFAPHVLAAVVGDTLRVHNADPVLHNIRGRLLGESRSLLNVVQPTQGQETDREIRRAGVLGITCDTHPNMQAYLLAFEHPYFAVTDERGRFRLTGVPPGAYRVVAWHEGWWVTRMERGRPVFEEPHVREVEVTAPGKGTARVTFELSDAR